MTNSHSSKVYLQDLEEIELSLSLNPTTTSQSTIIRTSIQTTDTFIFYDQLTFSNSVTTQRIYLPYSYNTPITLKLETVSSSDGQQSPNEVTMSLSSLLDSPKRCLSLKIGSETELNVAWTAPERSPVYIYMTIESLGLKFPSSWFKRTEPKPYIKVARCVTGAEDVIVYTSEAINAKGFNSWGKFKVRANELCKGDKWSPIKIIVCYKAAGSEKILGEGICSLEQLLSDQNTVTLADKNRQKCVGSLRVTCELANNVTFNDCVKAGLKFNTLLAVDFSDAQYILTGLASNHFAKSDKNFANDYQKVMAELWPLLSQANNLDKLPAYGLGGSKKYRDNTKGTCFDVREESSNESHIKRKSREEATGPWVSSLNDLMIAYEDMVINNKLGGRCRMAGVIEKAKCLAKFNTLYKSQEYVVLVIVTDGYIDDYEQTLRTLKSLYKLPISVLFVEVGSGKKEDLDHMERSLDMMEKRPCVSFMKFARDGNKLVKEVVREIPRHVQEFIENERETQVVSSEEAMNTMNTESETQDITPKNMVENRESVLRRTVPPMMKNWIYENNKKEFVKAKERVEKMAYEFRTGKTLC